MASFFKSKYGALITAARLDLPIGVLDARSPRGVRYLPGERMESILPSDCFDFIIALPVKPAALAGAAWAELELENFAHSLS